EDYLYIATSNAIMIVNISSGFSLESEIWDGDGEFNYLDTPEDIELVGDYLYVVSSDEDAVTIIDVSDKSDPDLVAEFYDGDGEFDYLDRPRSVKAEGKYLFVTSLLDNAVTL